jgi:hypothetical protein
MSLPFGELLRLIALLLLRQDLNVWHRETQLQPTARRTEKINRARRERELQQALEQLQKRRGALCPPPALRALPCREESDLINGLHGAGSNLASNEEEGDDHVDEELERELWLNTIQLAILKAIHELEAIEQARTTSRCIGPSQGRVNAL